MYDYRAQGYTNMYGYRAQGYTDMYGYRAQRYAEGRVRYKHPLILPNWTVAEWEKPDMIVTSWLKFPDFSPFVNHLSSALKSHRESVILWMSMKGRLVYVGN